MTMQATVFTGHAARESAWTRLGISVFLQAVDDLKHASLIQKWDALLWLTTSDDVRIILDAVGMVEADPYYVLANLSQIQKFMWRKKR